MLSLKGSSHHSHEELILESPSWMQKLRNSRIIDSGWKAAYVYLIVLSPKKLGPDSLLCRPGETFWH